jgi:hypothetical protein
MGGLRETHRNMENVRHTDCASRVFNLLDLTARMRPPAGAGAVAEPVAIEPFFAHPALNAVIFVRHRLRHDERSLFADGRTVATKVFLPFNRDDLGDGGRFVFIGERGWRKTCLDLFGLDAYAEDPDSGRDLTILEILDELPSLDPFLLRERLRAEGIEPALSYFRLPDADYAAISEGVAREFLRLARPELRHVYRSRRSLGRILRMMWDCRDPAIVGPLTETLEVAADDLDELMFAWKGFIYYKSLLPPLNNDWRRVRAQIASTRISANAGCSTDEPLDVMRSRVLSRMQKELAGALDIVRLYDRAYRNGLLERRQPGEFRTFLGRAPELLPRLGSAVAGIHHANTFWRYRFGDVSAARCDACEFHEILTDFSTGFAGDLVGPPPSPASAALLLS